MVLGAGTVQGQDFPNRPIRIVTGGTGGVLDTTARLVAQGLSSSVGQQVIVENRASGLIPSEIVSNAQPDGYTLLMTGSSLWIQPLLEKVSYDAVKDFAPVTLAVNAPNIMVLHPSVAAKSVQEFIAIAKAKPGVLNYASGQPGTSVHMAAELLKYMTGINMIRVPYKSAGAAVIGLLSGEAQVMFGTAPSVMPHVKSGKLRALAVTTAQPSQLAPGLPTMASAGLPGYVMVGAGNGIMAPPKTPAAIINRLSRDIVRVLHSPDVKEKLFLSGIEVIGSSPAEFAAAIKSDIKRGAEVIKFAGIGVN
jgi:tripartite-type tricarboxylate transporter receptor subunit TctC